MNFYCSLFAISFLFISSCSSLRHDKSSDRARAIATVETNYCGESLKAFLSGADFLHKIDPAFHKSLRTSNITKRIHKTNKPVDQIAYWLSLLERVSKNSNIDEKLKTIEKIRDLYHIRYIIIKDEVPESYFHGQRRLARNQGHGDVQITDGRREELVQILIDDQRESLDTWINYFLSSDADVYPVWVKYWSFEGMLKLGFFDKKTGKFSKRVASTTAPFPELHRDAFALVVDSLVRQVEGLSLDELTDQKFKELLKSGSSFSKLYSRQLKLLKETSPSTLKQTEGKWVKYDQGSSADELTMSLRGKSTGWCTTGHSTATSQLRDGDFYVYYSKDGKGEMTNPRLAIRMKGKHVTEVRGVAADQNIDEYISKSDILDKKLKEFGQEGEHYHKKTKDMKRLTYIDERLKRGGELSKSELLFLYEIDHEIVGFGYKKDPRISEILSTRDKKKDLSSIFNCRKDQISLTKEEALSGDIIYHYGNLNLRNYTPADGIKLPENIGGSLYIADLKSAKGLRLPVSVGGDLDLQGLVTADGLKLPENIGGYLNLRKLISADGLELPDHVGSYIDLQSVISAVGLKFPKKVYGHLSLNSLMSAKGLRLPEEVGGILDLSSLKSGDSLILPKIVRGNLNLYSLVSAKGLVFPKSVGGTLDLHSLTAVDGLVFPDSVGGDLDLYSITTAKRLKFPTIIGGNLDLSGLKIADGLIFPDSIGRFLKLPSLTSTRNVTLPSHIGGDLDLRSLISADGLMLSNNIDGDLNLSSLKFASGLTFPKNLRSLISAHGLIFPEGIGGNLDLRSLRSIDGFKLPDYIEGYLNLESLLSLDGIDIPAGINKENIVTRFTTSNK
jgi:phage protein U